MVGWYTSAGGCSTVSHPSTVSTRIAVPAASMAPRQAGADVCGRSTVTPHRSASSCSSRGCSLNSPPTIRRSRRGHEARSWASASSRSRVWKQIAS